MGHELGAHDTLLASDKSNIVFGRLLLNVRGRLAVVLCQFRRIIVQSGPQVELDLFSRFLGIGNSPRISTADDAWQNCAQVYDDS